MITLNHQLYLAIENERWTRSNRNGLHSVDVTALVDIEASGNCQLERNIVQEVSNRSAPRTRAHGCEFHPQGVPGGWNVRLRAAVVGCPNVGTGGVDRCGVLLLEQLHVVGRSEGLIGAQINDGKRHDICDSAVATGRMCKSKAKVQTPDN